MSPTVNAESAGTTMFGTSVSDMQEDVAITAPSGSTNGKITGTLFKQTTGDLVDAWGEGYFLGVKFNASNWAQYDSVKVGLKPTYPNGGSTSVNDDSGLVEVKTDPDKNGAFKITNPVEQKFLVVATKGSETVTATYDLDGLSGKYYEDNEWVTDDLWGVI